MGTHVVTGSASGLGAATAKRLETAGHRVIGVDRRDAEIVADLGTHEGRSLAIREVTLAAGGRLDGVVSCAGLAPFDEPGPVVKVNYFGAMGMLDGLCEVLARGSQPAAVAITSVGGVFEALAVPACPMLDGLLRREEHAAAIRALAVPLARSALPEEVAGAILFLLGPDASYVHGQVLFVDGGSDAVARPDTI